MSIAQAIQAGASSNEYRQPNFIARMPNFTTPAVRPSGGGGGKVPTSPHEIFASASAIALEEERVKQVKLANELKQQEITLKAEDARAKYQTAQQTQKIADQTAFDVSQTSKQALSDKRFAAGQAESKMWADADKEKEAHIYRTSMQSLVMGDTAPILNYIRTYGDPNQSIDKIEFSPDGKTVDTYMNGDKVPNRQNRNEFMAFMGAFDPKVMESISNIATSQATAADKERQRSQKDKEIGIRGKTLSLAERKQREDEWDAANNPMNMTLTEAQKLERSTFVGGAKEPAVQLKGWVKVGTDKNKDPGGGARYSEKQGAWLVPADNKSSPNPDKTGQGTKTEETDKTPDRNTELFKHPSSTDVKSDKEKGAGKKEPAIPTDKGPKESPGTATYTDPKTGDTVKVTTDSRGKTIKKEVIKKKNKKKKKKGSNA